MKAIDFPQKFYASELIKETIQVFDPLSEFLHGSEVESRFKISLLDVVRLSGHSCPSMTGAFLVTKAAVRHLFPTTNTCVRGDIEVLIPDLPEIGATGPIANVISYITGAWGGTGFGGLKGQFRRRDLLRFNCREVPAGAFRFTRKSTNQTVDVSFHPERVSIPPQLILDFQEQWRGKVHALLTHQDQVIDLNPVEGILPNGCSLP
jgi:hypothetical protein